MNLHSSMERLKDITFFFVVIVYFDLHSSMERLKAITKISLADTFKYLHSSMERLKVFLQCKVLPAYAIYIPVWRD